MAAPAARWTRRRTLAASGRRRLCPRSPRLPSSLPLHLLLYTISLLVSSAWCRCWSCRPAYAAFFSQRPSPLRPAHGRRRQIFGAVDLTTAGNGVLLGLAEPQGCLQLASFGSRASIRSFIDPGV